MSGAARTYYDTPDVNPLMKLMGNLIEEYEDTRLLIGDQIQALVKSDLDRMSKITLDQTEKYEVLKRLETEFKDEVNRLFEQCDSTEKEKTLTNFLNNLRQPNVELNAIRQTLRQQVEITQKFKEQLQGLIEFAKDHNAETLRSIYEREGDSSMHYGERGERKTILKSVAINRKA